MKDIISQLEKEAYDFKKPWKPKNKSLAIVVPVVARCYTDREYVVLDEVKNDVKITDTGGIDKAKVEGNVDKAVFIRGGTMLKGQTQERATQFGIVIIPQKSEQVPVRCIHASRGISPGASLIAAGYAPRRVYSTMLSNRSQHATWGAVSCYNAQISTQAGLHFAGSDDLVSVVETIDKFRTDMIEILKEAPNYQDQVGIVVIDTNGILGLEIYDHPTSWKAFAETIICSFSDTLTKEEQVEIFKPNMKAVIPTIKSFLKQISKFAEEVVFDKDNTKTVIIKSNGYVGEYTTLNNRTLHLLITRKEKSEDRAVGFPRGGNYTIDVGEQTTSYPIWHGEQTTSQWKCGARTNLVTQYAILNSLDTDKTWTSLRTEIPVSKATLSSHLKQLQQIKAVEKSKGTNGVTHYKRTGIGYELVKKKSKEKSNI